MLYPDCLIHISSFLCDIFENALHSLKDSNLAILVYGNTCKGQSPAQLLFSCRLEDQISVANNLFKSKSNLAYHKVEHPHPTETSI